MLAGQLLAYAGMLEGKNVSWLPSYGPEMRGGTANCNVMIADSEVASPIITTDATCAIIMNLPSLVKFENHVLPKGSILVNCSLIDKKVKRKDVTAHYIPANKIAMDLGNNRVANIVMLGAYLQLFKIVKPESVIAALKKSFGDKKAHLIAINEQALAAGMAEITASQSNCSITDKTKKKLQPASVLGCKI